MKTTTMLIAATALALPLAAFSQITTNGSATTGGPNTATGTNASTQTNVTAPTGGALNNTTPAAADTKTKMARPKRSMQSTPAVEPATEPGSTTTRSPNTPTSKNDGSQKP